MSQFKVVTPENIDELQARLNSLPPESSLTHGRGGGGYTGGMEARVKALEEAVKNLPTKVDLDSMRQATKTDFTELRLSAQADASSLRADSEKFRADSIKSSGELRGEFEKLRGDVGKGFAEVRADMHKNSVDIQRWMIATVIGLFLGFGGLFLAMSNALKQPASAPQATIQPAQQPPIIINVPAAQSTPPAPPQQ